MEPSVLPVNTSRPGQGKRESFDLQFVPLAVGLISQILGVSVYIFQKAYTSIFFKKKQQQHILVFFSSFSFSALVLTL